MKKLYCFLALGLLSISPVIHAETVSGRVVHQDGNVLTVQTSDGTTAKMALTENTKYREKKMVKHDTKKGDKTYPKGTTYYKPLVEEDDWIELTYTPATTSNTMDTIEDVIVYDD